MAAPSLDDMYRMVRGIAAFDDAFYLGLYPDVAADGRDPLAHYLAIGWRERRRPAPFFDPGQYLQENPDVAQAGIDPFFHFLFRGIHEGRRVPVPGAPPQVGAVAGPADGRGAEEPPAARFDAAWYRAENPDVAAAGVDAAAHYRSHGEREGRRPNPFFDPRYYARVHADVAESGLGLFEHFRAFGWREGRSAADPAPDRQRWKSGRHALFIGHDAIQAGAQTVLLETVRWFADHTDIAVTVLLCDGGPLTERFAALAEVFALHRYRFDADRLAPLFGRPWDFVYANTVRSGTVLRAVVERLRRPAPVVTHLHEFDRVLMGFPAELDAALAVSDRFVVVHERIAARLAHRHGVSPERIAVERPFIRAALEGPDDAGGADAARIAARRQLGVAEATVLVTGCGTADARKGIDLFVETGLALLARYRGRSLAFAWIGDGPDLAAARQRVEAAGAAHAFLFPGHRPDAAALVGGADLFFLASREDPFPLVCLEAAQYGIPIVHFDRGTGIGAFVRAEDAAAAAGVSVPAFVPEAAAERLAALLGDLPLRHALGARGRARLFAAHEAEAGLAALFQRLLAWGCVAPSVSVVVPNYNHAAYLDARLRSVRGQTLKSIEVIVLDDASTDGSRAVIDRHLDDPRLAVHGNATNSGSPFAQWARGVALARGEVVWIAESDDLAAPGFLRALIGAFADPLVTVAAGCCRVIDPEGHEVPGALDAWFDGAARGLFDRDWTRDGIAVIRDHLGMRNTLVNASALLLRRAALGPALEGAAAYRLCGDWLVYLRMLRGGKLAFAAEALSFFRRHPTSTVQALEGTPTYFRERSAVAAWVLDHAHLSRTEARRLLHELEREWARFAHRNPGDRLDRYVDGAALLAKAGRRRGTVAFYVHGLLFSKGGIERLAAQLANALVIQGYRVVLYCAERRARPVFALLEGVAVHGVALEGEDGAARLADRLRRDGVDVFVPMLSERLFEPAVEAGLRAGVQILVSEHNDPWAIEAQWWSAAARARCFAKADRIHLLLPAYAASLPEALRGRVVVIPNGVPRDEDAAAAPESRRIVCVARLAPQKRLDLLVDAFALLAPARPAWTLLIVGEGAEEEALRARIAAAGLSARISLPGTSDAVPTLLAQSAIFVLPSAFEGFPIVLLEAQRAGLPCVAFRCCNGANALIAHQKDGLLVEPFGAPALAAALLRLIDDAPLRQAFGEAARQAAAAYDLEAVIARWVETLDALVTAAG